MKFLISVLGDITGYDKVKYTISDYESESRISTKVLYEYLKPDTTITFIPFTLYHKLLGKLKGGKYGELAKELSDASKEYIKKHYGEELNFNFFIAPTIGTFFDKDTQLTYTYTEKFKGLNLYQNYVYHKLISEVEKVEGNSIEFHVDLTHGINYMPTILSNVIMTIANSIGKQVKLSFYNSDPIAGKFKETPTLNINEVSRYVINPKDGMLLITNQFLSIEPNYYRKVIRDKVDRVRRLARAFQAGLFLLINYYRKEIDEVKELVEGKFKGIENMDVIVEGCCKLKYDYDLHYSAYILHSMLTILSRVSLGKEELEAGELIELAKKYANELSEVLLTNEIDDIRSKVSNELADYTKLDEVFKKAEGKRNAEQQAQQDTPNKRNLIAHGGLERNITLVKYSGGKLYFKYLDPEKALNQL